MLGKMTDEELFKFVQIGESKDIASLHREISTGANMSLQDVETLIDEWIAGGRLMRCSVGRNTLEGGPEIGPNVWYEQTTPD